MHQFCQQYLKIEIHSVKTFKKTLFRLTIFFCGLHFLVGLADQTEIALKTWDKLLYDDRTNGSRVNSGYSKDESGTLRLI